MRRLTLVAENSFMSDPAGGGIAPVDMPWVIRCTRCAPTSWRTWASATSWRTWPSWVRPVARAASTTVVSARAESCPMERPLV